ncbi:hypothetical protein OK074_6676 [Actinobacteria bacterium OK074]|nr:hypothetical protein OK074_6676 [Actinobacteria bacterium OK074]
MTEKPDIGTIAKDTRNGKVGRVMGHVGRYIQLRPLKGGLEWDVPPEHVEPATTSDTLSAAVAEANTRSQRGTLK